MFRSPDALLPLDLDDVFLQNGRNYASRRLRIYANNTLRV